jgi:hypothetical protein
MNDEAEDTQEESFKGIGWGWLLSLPLVLLLYVLSMGPSIFLVQKGFISRRSQTFRVLAAFYQPLEWASREVPLIDKPIGMYLHLWAPERFDRKGNHK